MLLTVIVVLVVITVIGHVIHKTSTTFRRLERRRTPYFDFDDDAIEMTGGRNAFA